MGNTLTVTGSTEVVAVEDCLSTTLDGESVILHTGAGEYYGFNEVGTEIWEFIQEPRTVEEITSHVMARYDVSESRCRGDVEDLVTELLEKDLARVTAE